MGKVKKATPKQVHIVRAYQTGLEERTKTLFLELRRTESMSSSFVEKDLKPRMKEGLLQLGALIQISQWENEYE